MIAHRKPLIPLMFPPAIAFGKLSGVFRGSSDAGWHQTDTDVLESEGATGGTLCPDHVTSSGWSRRWLGDRALRNKGLGGGARLAESGSRPATTFKTVHLSKKLVYSGDSADADWEARWLEPKRWYPGVCASRITSVWGDCQGLSAGCGAGGPADQRAAEDPALRGGRLLRDRGEPKIFEILITPN